MKMIPGAQDAGWSHPSKVNEFVSLNASESGMLTRERTPSKLKAWPVRPGANVVPKNNWPSCAPAASFGLPSARHHATNPEGTATQLLTLTVIELVAVAF